MTQARDTEALHPAEKHTMEFISKRGISVSENEGDEGGVKGGKNR